MANNGHKTNLFAYLWVSCFISKKQSPVHPLLAITHHFHASLIGAVPRPKKKKIPAEPHLASDVCLGLGEVKQKKAGSIRYMA